MENKIQKEELLALVKSKIYTIRGQKVMLDFDLAQMYEVETKRLNEAVRRNIKRFEGDVFMFRLTKDEIAHVALRSQFVTLETPLKSGDLEDSTRSRSQIATLNRGRGSNIKYLPYAFTELGVAMLSSVLKSETAINVNREIMRAFVHFRHLATTLPLPNTNADVIQLRKDFEELKLDIEDILHDQNDINESTRHQLEAISTALAELQTEHRQRPNRKPIGFIQPKDDNNKKSINDPSCDDLLF